MGSSGEWESLIRPGQLELKLPTLRDNLPYSYHPRILRRESIVLNRLSDLLDPDRVAGLQFDIHQAFVQKYVD